MTLALCHIPPASLTELLPKELSHHLCIADVIIRSDNADYARFYRRQSQAGKFVILDSAAFEGECTSPQILSAAARIIRPTEVVLSDDPTSATRTLTMSQECSRILRERGYTGRFMGVPHGKKLREYTQNAADLVEACGISTFGVVEEIPETLGIPRAEAVSVLRSLFPSVDIHLLGVSEDLNELTDPYLLQQARSCDTAKLIVWGLQKKLVAPGNVPPYPGRKALGGRMQYFEYVTTDVFAWDAAIANIETWERALCAVSSEAP